MEKEQDKSSDTPDDEDASNYLFYNENDHFD